MIKDLPIFYEPDHSYIGQFGDMAGKKYLSVSTLIHKFEPQKNWGEIAEKYVANRSREEIILDLAYKNNLEIEELADSLEGVDLDADFISDFWKKNNKDACDKGHSYHLMRENRWKEMEARGLRVFTNPVDEKGYKIARSLDNLEDGVHSELMIWSEEYGICGQADEPRFRNRVLALNDYKTNKKLKFKSFKGEKMLGPLKHILNCNYWHYCLQLSLYAYLLEMRGYEVEKLTLEYVPEDCKKYDLPYLRKEVIDMLNWYKNGII